MVYGRKNDSFCLAANMPAESDDTWSFHAKVIIHRKRITKDFVGKVDYNPSKMTLCINNLTIEDSGTYTADVVHGGETVEKKVFTFRLEVQSE